MARIESDKKMSFYPTFYNTIMQIIRILGLNTEARQGTTIIDPCCGDGSALEQFQNEAKASVYGVELNHDRNKLAYDKLGKKILSGNALFDIRRTLFGSGVLFLNPPYATQVGNSNSLEVAFVKSWQYDVCNGGIMVLIVNSSTLKVMDKELEKFDLLGCFHDDKSDDYKKYGQKIFILKKKTVITKSRVNLLEAYNASTDINGVEPLKIANFKKGRKSIPVWEELKTPVWKLDLLSSNKKEDLRKKFAVRVNGYGSAIIDKNSVMQVSETHSAFLIATGLISDRILTLKDGTRIILKGTVEKYSKVSDKKNEEGEVIAKVTSEDYSTNVVGLDIDTKQFVYYSA